MIVLLKVLAGLTLFTGAGAGLAGLFPESEHVDDPLHAGWCFLAGTAFAGLLLHLPLAIAGRIPHPVFLIVFGVCLVLALGPGLAHVRGVGPSRFFGLDLFLSLPFWLRAVSVVLILLATSTAFGPFVGWDERAIFGLKARILFHEGSVRGEAFSGVDILNFQAGYPLLVPLLEAALLTLVGSADDQGLKLLFLAFCLALVLVVAGEARRLAGVRAGGFWGFLLLATPMLIGPSEGRGITGYADIALAAYATGATILLGRAIDAPVSGRVRTAGLAGLLLGAALATKQEGALWGLALGFAFLLILWRRPGTRTAGLARVVAATAVSALAFFAVSIAAGRWTHPPVPWESYATVFRLDWLSQLAGRPLEVAPFVLRRLVDGQSWGWGWLLVPIGLVALRRPRLGPAPLLWRGTALAVFVADVGIFIVTPNHVQWHLVTAFSRLLLQLFPLALLILAEHVSASAWLPRGFGALEPSTRMR